MQPATAAVKGTDAVASGKPTAARRRTEQPARQPAAAPVVERWQRHEEHSLGLALERCGRAASRAQQRVVQHHGVITVGGIYDETGPIDATVERDTVRSYFDLVNSQGGVNGYKLRLIDCDSKYDPSSAHQCAQKLISQGVLAIVGWLSLSGEQSEAKYLTGQGVPIIGGLGVPAEYAVAAVVPDDAQPRHHRHRARHAGRQARAQEARASSSSTPTSSSRSRPRSWPR